MFASPISTHVELWTILSMMASAGKVTAGILSEVKKFMMRR